MPVDSTSVISITTHIDRMAGMSKVGMPKCSGVISAIALASLMPSKETFPSAIATRVPMTMPSSTAQLEIRPRPYLLSNRIATSTSAAMPRFPRSP